MNRLNFILSLLFAFVLAHTASADKGGSISQRNELKEKADKAYAAGNYEEAAVHLSILVDSLKIDDPKLTYNLASIEMKADKLESAARRFSQLVNTPDKKVRSLAEQHLGVMAAKDGKLDDALTHLKNALRADPTNKQARYNYELLKKQKEQQDKEDQKSDKDEEKKDEQQKKDEQKKENQKKDEQQKKEGDEKQEKGDKGEEEKQDKKEGEQGEEKKEEKGKQGEQEKKKPEEGKGEEEKEAPAPGEENEEKEGEGKPQQFEEIDISEEKAKMILEALRNREAQYLQQRQRKTEQRQPNNLPDW